MTYALLSPSSGPGLTRASTPILPAAKRWMAGSSPAMTGLNPQVLA